MDLLDGALFLILKGDGSPEFFDRPILARKVTRDWFPQKIERGEAYLLKIEDGAVGENYIAITSRVDLSLEEQVASRYISAVVHRVINPGSGFMPSVVNPLAIGIALVEVVEEGIQNVASKQG